VAVMPGAVKGASGAAMDPEDPRAARGRKGGVAYVVRRGVIPGEVLFAPARAVQVRYGDGMIIRAGGSEEAIRTPFGPVSVEED
jgi:hypothetical protein